MKVIPLITHPHFSRATGHNQQEATTRATPELPLADAVDIL
jgi:hypothetical protein